MTINKFRICRALTSHSYLMSRSINKIWFRTERGNLFCFLYVPRFELDSFMHVGILFKTQAWAGVRIKAFCWKVAMWRAPVKLMWKKQAKLKASYFCMYVFTMCSISCCIRPNLGYQSVLKGLSVKFKWSPFCNNCSKVGPNTETWHSGRTEQSRWAKIDIQLYLLPWMQTIQQLQTHLRHFRQILATLCRNPKLIRCPTVGREY